MCTRRQRSIVVSILTKQAEKLVGVLSDQLGELRVAGTELLEDGLQHLGLLLDDLTELLKLGVISQEIQVAESLTTSSRSSRGGGGTNTGTGTTSASSTSGATASCLRGKVEQVYVTVVVDTSSGSSGRGSGRLRGGSCGSLLLLQILGDTLGHVSQVCHSYPTSSSLLTLKRYSTARSGL